MLLVLRDKAKIDTSGRAGTEEYGIITERWMERTENGEISGRLKCLMDLRITADYEMDACPTIHDAKKSLELCNAVLRYISKTL